MCLLLSHNTLKNSNGFILQIFEKRLSYPAKSKLCCTFAAMNFHVLFRVNPATGNDERYFRLKESFRDATGMVRNRTILTVGFDMNDIPMEDVRLVGEGLTRLYNSQGNRSTLFGDIVDSYPFHVRSYIEKYWKQIVSKGKLDIVEKAKMEAHAKAERLVDTDTVKHTDAREIGAEWICLQAIRELEIDKFLQREGWTEMQVNTALAHLITRTIYSPSELKSLSIMEENSAVCELVSGNQDWCPGLHSIYKVAPRLYDLKDKLERHLCQKTDNLFNLTNRIVLFDLTNFYFEGRKERSKKAQFGRSKEKRSDCKLLVLALCINAEGFIRYSSILAGNTSDPDSLPDMIDTLSQKTRTPSDPKQKILVCLDAGIATEDNLAKIKEKGYNYLCVSRTRLTEYELAEDCRSVKVLDTKKQEITLRQVKHEDGGDYYLEINSPAKALKEESMNRQWRERFEAELTKARSALSKKGGKKNYEKVIERVGRAIQKYPSIARYYVIDYYRDEANPKNMADIQWRIAIPENVDRQSGIYFLRTNIDNLDEKATWDYYNTIRDIECTNRQLKTDLNLRPIYHRKDERSDAHLFFGLLSYWIVNTIRYKLKLTGEMCYWTEIVRRLSTQKAITTEAVNALGEWIQLRQCSEPTKAAEDIYQRLKYKPMPFKKRRKLCSTQ